MRKILVLFCFIAILMMTGCETVTYQEATGGNEQLEEFGNGYFTIITKWDGYKIVYANDTKVKYLVRQYGYEFGISPLYNEDGTLQIYEESEEKQ